MLRDYIETNGLTLLHTDEPTHYPSNGQTPSTIDICINKDVAGVERLDAITDMDSDHDPVCLTLPNIRVENDEKSIISFRETDWVAFRQKINEKLNLTTDIKTCEQLEESIRSFTRVVSE